MKILFISPYVPSLIRVRPYNFIRHLSNHGHQVTLLTLWSNAIEKHDLEDIQKYCHSVYAFELRKLRSYWNCLAVLPSPDPLQSAYCWEPEAAKQAYRLIEQPEFDVIHIEHLRGARYGLGLINGKVNSNTPPIVWDSVDSISHLFRQAARKSQAIFSRMITSFELSRTEVYESKLLDNFNHVLVTSPTDRDAFLALPGKRGMPDRISVLNNGVDLNYFCPDVTITRDEKTVVISGKLSYHANISMVLFLVNEIMPHVWSEKPETEVIIVGKDPAREIIALQENSQITVTGTVKDIRPYLRKATIAVTPITYGAGIQNKVLEAMACGTPVISTSQAISALKVVRDKELLVEDNPHVFAKAIISLLNDRQKQRSLGEAGRLYVEKFHDWDKITSQLEVMYNKVVDEKRKLPVG